MSQPPTAEAPVASGSSAAPTTEVPDAPGEAVIRVIAGSPTPTELAAVLAVLLAASDGPVEAPAAATSAWSAPALRLRTAYGPASGGWRASALPR